MDYSELTIMVREIKKKIACPSCQKKFSDKGIHVLATNRFEGNFYLFCESCQIAFLLSVFLPHVIIADLQELKKRSVMKPITQNDILDMHNFLKNFQNEDLSKFIK